MTETFAVRKRTHTSDRPQGWLVLKQPIFLCLLLFSLLCFIKLDTWSNLSNKHNLRDHDLCNTCTTPVTGLRVCVSVDTNVAQRSCTKFDGNDGTVPVVTPEHNKTRLLPQINSDFVSEYRYVRVVFHIHQHEPRNRDVFHCSLKGDVAVYRNYTTVLSTPMIAGEVQQSVCILHVADDGVYDASLVHTLRAVGDQQKTHEFDELWDFEPVHTSFDLGKLKITIKHSKSFLKECGSPELETFGRFVNLSSRTTCLRSAFFLPTFCDNSSNDTEDSPFFLHWCRPSHIWVPFLCNLAPEPDFNYDAQKVIIALWGTSRMRTEFYDLAQLMKKAIVTDVNKSHMDLHVTNGNVSVYHGWASCVEDVDGERERVVSTRELVRYNATVSHLKNWLMDIVMCQREDRMSFIVLSTGACEIDRGKLAFFEHRVTEVIQTTKSTCAKSTKIFWKTEEATHDVKFKVHKKGFSDIRMSTATKISRRIAEMENIEIVDAERVTYAATDFTHDGGHYYADANSYYGNEVSRSIALLIQRRIRHALRDS